MARALSNGKALFASLSDVIAAANSRRVFSAAAAAGRGVMAEEKAVLMKGKKDTAAAAVPDAAAAWLPDPVTGYYQPANRLREMDPAELRQMLLKNRA